MRFVHLLLIAPLSLVACAAESEPDDVSVTADNIESEKEPTTSEEPSGFREVLTKDGKHQGIFAGGHLYKENVPFIKNLGIKTVLSLQPTAEDLGQDLKDRDVGGWFRLDTAEEYRVKKSKMNFVRKSWWAKDERTVEFSDSVLSVLRKATPENPVYVHCWFGMDRTGSVVAMRRVVDERWKPVDAFHEWRNTTGRCAKYQPPERTFNKRVRALYDATKASDPRKSDLNFAILNNDGCYKQ